ncbi:MAG: hypothetical protein MPK10_08055 [Gammaproteobacteria bacterium]|nr:hypothetical protein [Gammaproteobacteria bacterium]
MNSFIVISPEQEKVENAVKTHFSEHHYEVMPGVWVVAGKDIVSSDICEKLDIKDGGYGGVVCALTAYTGFYQPALWEKLNLWERL